MAHDMPSLGCFVTTAAILLLEAEERSAGIKSGAARHVCNSGAAGTAQRCYSARDARAGEPSNHFLYRKKLLLCYATQMWLSYIYNHNASCKSTIVCEHKFYECID